MATASIPPTGEANNSRARSPVTDPGSSADSSTRTRQAATGSDRGGHRPPVVVSGIPATANARASAGSETCGDRTSTAILAHGTPSSR